MDRAIERSDLDGAVVVCGAGAAGLAAALSAARHGAPVVLLEAATRLGGTVTHALIHTLAGFYDAGGELINDGLCREITERLFHADPLTARRKMGRLWVLQVCPNSYLRTVGSWIEQTPRITVLAGAAVTDAVQSGNRIVELTASCAGSTLRWTPRAVIDATGTAELARLLDESLVTDDDHRSAGGWIFRLRGVASGALEFPRGLALVRRLREAAESGALPAECGKAWIDRGLYEDEAFVKLFVPLPPQCRDRQCRGEIVRRSQATQTAVTGFLRTLPEFALAHVSQSGSLGIRDGGRIRGQYMLTADDVRRGRKFADAVGRCSWPIEYWDPERGVSLEHLPDGKWYEIPMSSLRLPGLANYWAVGKCLSADRWAHASARVVGACWAMGEAAGKAAARCQSPGRVLCGGSS
jgi:hypothetical protein